MVKFPYLYLLKLTPQTTFSLLRYCNINTMGPSSISTFDPGCFIATSTHPAPSCFIATPKHSTAVSIQLYSNISTFDSSCFTATLAQSTHVAIPQHQYIRLQLLNRNTNTTDNNCFITALTSLTTVSCTAMISPLSPVALLQHVHTAPVALLQHQHIQLPLPYSNINTFDSVA